MKLYVNFNLSRIFLNVKTEFYGIFTLIIYPVVRIYENLTRGLNHSNIKDNKSNKKSKRQKTKNKNPKLKSLEMTFNITAENNKNKLFTNQYVNNIIKLLI